ncbi:hypothetical protein NDI47_22100 [Microcoleus vaginatus GB1-A2]|uniref:hypothetical protein n=1 Tax=Microcoleus vaginatus TaxID=119532 RepID=UPI0016894F81|nr:hypothetical protein [Microcoleus sp. FACHB-61]
MLFFIITQELSFGVCGNAALDSKELRLTKARWGFRHLSSYVNKSPNTGFVPGFTLTLDRHPNN